MTWFDASFGSSKTSLATVGVEEYDNTGSSVVARTTTGVVETAGGQYGRDWTQNAATVTLSWDTGEGTPIYAHETIRGLSPTEQTQLDEIHIRLGLKSGNAITDTKTGIDSALGDIDIDRTGDGKNTSTLTRQ